MFSYEYAVKISLPSGGVLVIAPSKQRLQNNGTMFEEPFGDKSVSGSMAVGCSKKDSHGARK
jgi:hypothetical protein